MAKKSGVQGLSNLRKVLRRLPAEATSEMRETIEHVANGILRDARSRSSKWRRVSENLSVQMSRDRLSARIGIIGKRAAKRAYMARWLHFGTQPHSLEKGLRLGGHGRGGKQGRGRALGAIASRTKLHPGIPANPYLFNAYEGRKKSAIALIRSAIDRTLKRAAGKQ